VAGKTDTILDGMKIKLFQDEAGFECTVKGALVDLDIYYYEVQDCDGATWLVPTSTIQNLLILKKSKPSKRPKLRKGKLLSIVPS